MELTLFSDDAREERLQLFYQRQIASFTRTHASKEKVEEALDLVRDARLPRFSVEFGLNEEGGYVPGRWVVPPGLGAAFEKYVSSLREMEMIRFGRSVVDGFTVQHDQALDAVVEAAEALAMLGWPVNWQQNVQTILECTEYGLRDGKLAHRFADLPRCVTLGDELLLLGTVTFHRQNRSVEGIATSFKPNVLSLVNKRLYENTPLYLRDDDESLPARFRYASHWLPGKSGASYRVAV